MKRMKILFIGGPLHMQTKEFDGRPPYEYHHPLPFEQGTWLDVVKAELRTIRYGLRQVSIEQPSPPFYPKAPAVLDFRVYAADGEKEADHPDAARYLLQMWPEISVAGRLSSSTGSTP